MSQGRALASSLALSAALVLVGASGCGAQIGDECAQASDCDPEGTRICDTSQPGGYCTIEGCDRSTNKCPGESVCIRFFSALDLTKPCSPADEAVCQDRTPGCDPEADASCCRCTADEECISEGFCVRRDLEQRSCMRKCGSNSDCRDGYDCYSTGVGGAELIPLEDGSQPPAARFCAPAR